MVFLFLDTFEYRKCLEKGEQQNPLKIMIFSPRDFVVFLFLDTFHIQRIFAMFLFLDTFGLMLDQVPSELSAAGAKRGVRSVPF